MRALHPTLLSIALAGPAFGQDDALQRCRSVTESAARLACYDALADAAARQRTPVAPAPAPVTASAAPASKGADAGFGLAEQRRPGTVESVTSAVGASFAGWGPNSRIRLENGQVWQVIDGTSVVLPEGARKVSVKRGALGSFYLDFEGLKTSPRVRRVE